jgi:uncharacterized protein (UPF0261 family)
MGKERPITIVLVGTLDTKGMEVGYIQKEIHKRGHETIVVDAGVVGVPQIQADITREDVAKSGGISLDQLRKEAQKSSDRMQLIQVMIEGVKKSVRKLRDQDKLDGILSVGGSMGMAIGAGAMKALPVGIPKLMIGTHFYPQYLGEVDLTIMQCPTDIMGLNPVTNVTLSQAAAAICAMAEGSDHIRKTRPLVAMTALGVTTPAVMSIQKLLEDRGYDTVGFHGNSEVMDQLVDRGVIDGILDFSPNELIRIFIIGETPRRASRLDSAGRKGLPQVIVPASLDMIVLRMAKNEIPEAYKDRKIYMHGPYITGVRTSKEELKRLAGIVSDKFNRATGPAAVVFPLRGFSAIDREGFAFYEPETDRVFLDELKRKLKKDIEIIEVDAHILDDHFAAKVVDVYDEVAKKGVMQHG